MMMTRLSLNLYLIPYPKALTFAKILRISKEEIQKFSADFLDLLSQLFTLTYNVQIVLFSQEAIPKIISIENEGGKQCYLQLIFLYLQEIIYHIVISSLLIFHLQVTFSHSGSGDDAVSHVFISASVVARLIDYTVHKWAIAFHILQDGNWRRSMRFSPLDQLSLSNPERERKRLSLGRERE